MIAKEPAESIDLLVHPFHAISKVSSRFIIDEESERNILTLKSKWLESISDVTRDEKRYFVLVNGTDVPDGTISRHEYANPYRLLYKEVISNARHLLRQRLFYFSPRISANSFSLSSLDDRLILASAGDNSIVYDPTTINIIAYGEHTDEVTNAGCVDTSVRDLTTVLHIPQHRVVIDPGRSLPSQPLIKNQYGYEVPTTLYLTVTQLKQLSKDS